MTGLRNKKIKLRLKNRTVIIIGIVGVFLAAVMILSIWQWNNITALRYRLTYTPEELNTKIGENEQKIAEIMNQTATNNVRDLTDAEKELLASNEITKEEAIKLILEDTEQGTPPLGTGVSESEAPTTESVTSTVNYDVIDTEVKTTTARATDEIVTETETTTVLSAAETENIVTEGDTARLEDISQMETKLTELIAEAYVLRAYYSSQLEGMRTSALAEYQSLSTEERTQQNKRNIGMKYINLAGVLEDECDGLMNDLITRIESELKQTGGDTSVIGEIRSYYAEEKSLKKAYYISLYS